MLLRKYQINDTLRLYATLSALHLLCFNKNPDDGGGWNSERNRTDLFQQDENVFVDLLAEEPSSTILFNQDDMSLRKILEESTFQTWQSHLARKSLVEDLIRFDRNDNDRKITLYPLDIKNETQEASNSSVSLSSYDSRPFSLFQLPNDTRNFDSLAAFGLDERKPYSFNDIPTQDVFLDNSFYDLHLNTISNASNSSSPFLSSSSPSFYSSSSLPSSSSSSSSSSHRKGKKNPLKKDAVLPNINRIRRQDIDFFNRFNREFNDTEEGAAGPAMREQESLTMMTNAFYKQDVDLGYTFSNFNPSFTSLSAPIDDAEKIEVIQNLNDTKINESNEHVIDIGYLLSLSSANLTGNSGSSPSSHQKPVKVDEDRKLAEILYEQDIDLGYILSPTNSKEASPSKAVDQATKKPTEKEDSNDVGDLWAGIPFKIDNETGEYIRLPFEDILKDLIDESESKDESEKNKEPQSPLDIDATIEDIANLFTPPSGFFGMQNHPEVAQYMENNLCYEPQHEQVYDYNNQRVTNYYQHNIETIDGQSANPLYAASGGIHDDDSGVHNDAYLDSILNSECFKMMTANSSKSSEGRHHSNANEATGSGGGKNFDQSHNSSRSAGGGNVRNFLDLSCGSAGSSLGSLSSESLPSNSDGEWEEGREAGSRYRSNFYGPYDYSSNNSNITTKKMPVAQKKYHMFGKRLLQEEINNNTIENSKINTLREESPITKQEGKENATLDDFEDETKAQANLKNISKLFKKNVKTERDKFKDTDQNIVYHNHTYTMGYNHVSNPALERDDSEYGDGQSEEGHLTRDEKRARSLNVPIPVHDIINLPMDEFNECVSKHDLSENQLSLIRDIRRRGKNKVAAQNCRKRKLDTILSLESEVEEVRRRKEKLHNEQEYVAMEKKRVASKFAALHKHIFHHLKDDDGKPCLPSKFSLQQATDGSMYLLPRDSSHQGGSNSYMSLLMGEAGTSGSSKDRKRMKESFSRTSSDDTNSSVD